jgi:hypothetical protein
MGMRFESRREDELSKHLELAERFLAEGRELIDKDPVQASEKLYKAAEEVIKALAKFFNLSEARDAEKLGRWTTELLFKATLKLSSKIGEDIRSWWHTAWVLHVEGFHEAKLGSDYVASSYSHIEALVRLAKNVVQK